MFIPLLLIFSSLLLVAFYNFHWKRRKLPPGPTPWPILGNLVEVAKDKTNFQIFRKWADQFGPIYTAWWAEEPYIIITDYQLMKDAYVKQAEAFSGRHLLPISNILSEANHSAGVARINGESWRELRKFSMKLLRDLGVGRNGMQERILPTVKAIVRKLDTDLSNDIAEFNMLPFFNFFTANVINELTFATGFDGNNHHHYEQLMHLSETIHSNFTSIFGLLLALIPPLRHLPIFKNTFNKMNGPWEAFHAYFEQGIQQRIAHRQAMGGGQRRYSVVRKRSGSIEATMAAIRKRSGSGGAAANGMRSRKQSNEMQQIQKKMSGAGPVKKKSSTVRILKQTQNMMQQQGLANSKENLGEMAGEIGGGGGGVFQKPMRKFSSTAVGRKVSRMQWTVVVEREQTPSECFVDLFLDKLDQQGPDKFFNMDSLRGMCFDLFVGGQEPTASTLGFMTIYMLMDQQRQKKLHAEMDAFALEKGWNGEFEEDEWIGLADRPKLPYLNAVINETQRIVNILPMNLTHQTTCEAQIGDFLLPKGIAVVSQISSIFYDPKLFPEPEKFIPERFIDENGQLKKCEELVPFSLGKRNCIGEGLARAELFLFAANFFNKFHVLPADPLRPPSIEKKIYFTAMPLPYRCCLVRRKHLLPPPPCSPRSPLFFKEEAGSVELQLPCSSGNNSDDDFVPVFPILPPVPPKKGWAVEKEKENAPEEGDMAKNEGEQLANPAAKLLDPKDIEEPSKAMMPKKRNNSIRKNGIFTPPQSPQHQQQQQMLIGSKMEEDGAKKGRN